MFSSLPPTVLDHEPLPVICENLQRLSTRTNREFQRYLKDYAAAQARNRGVYAAQGEKERKAWNAEEPHTYQRREGVEDYLECGMESPFLRARVHLRKAEQEQGTSQGGTGDRVSIQIKEKLVGPNGDWEESHKHTNAVTSRENRTRTKSDENEDVRERIERSKSQYSILNETHSFSTELLPRTCATPSTETSEERDYQSLYPDEGSNTRVSETIEEAQTGRGNGE